LIIKSWADPNQHVTIVGDPDQSIYAWRAADVKNVDLFLTQYPNCTKFNLEQNYRSTKSILNTSHKLIKQGNFGFIQIKYK
jgi:DNA helicase-2/ATP-dependent DNA helicase PcrA